MSTYLCPSCQGRGNEAVYSNSGGARDIVSSQPCMTCAGKGSIGASEPKGYADCPKCKGEGSIELNSPLSGLRGDVVECSECDGRGAIVMPIGFRCPFCGTAHAPQGDCHAGADIACCGEVGHCEPIYKDNDEDVF